jgi:3-oxoacyl-(acyl-carrier-protein) synthase
MRRVAITGLGVISAVGTGTSAFFQSLLSARSGIRAVDIPFPPAPKACSPVRSTSIPTPISHAPAC